MPVMAAASTYFMSQITLLETEICEKRSMNVTNFDFFFYNPNNHKSSSPGTARARQLFAASLQHLCLKKNKKIAGANEIFHPRILGSFPSAV